MIFHAIAGTVINWIDINELYRYSNPKSKIPKEIKRQLFLKCWDLSFLSAIISTSPAHTTYRASSIMSSSRSSARPLRRTFLVSMVIWMHSPGALYNLRRHHCVRVLLGVLFVIFLCHCDICSHTDNVIEGLVNGVCLHFSFLGVSTQN